MTRKMSSEMQELSFEDALKRVRMEHERKRQWHGDSGGGWLALIESQTAQTVLECVEVLCLAMEYCIR